jgi:hypothetical protein
VRSNLKFGLARLLFWAYIGAGVLGLIAEVTARAVDNVYEGVPYLAAPDFNHDLLLLDTLGPRGRPNGHFQKWKLNSAGFRSPESALIAQPGCTRVMTIGSSETFGAEGESPNKEYPAQLSDSLRGRGCYQVLNAAIVGMSLRSAIQVWDRWDSRFHPDVAVVLASPAMYLGDRAPVFAPEPPRTLRDTPGPPWWKPRLITTAKQYFDFPDFIQHWRVQRKIYELTSGHPRGWMFDSIPHERLEDYRRDLDSIVVTIRSHGAQPILVTHPIRAGATIDASDRILLDGLRTFVPRARRDVIVAFDSAAAEVVREVGRRTHTPVCELRDVMNGKHQLFDDVVHFSDQGAGVVAGAAANVIQQLGTSDRSGSRPNSR